MYEPLQSGNKFLSLKTDSNRMDRIDRIKEIHSFLSFPHFLIDSMNR
jgi:hypothetical protein